MESNNDGAGTAVAELPAPADIAGGLTLFQIEESVALLAESAEEEGLTPEIERALAVYLEGSYDTIPTSGTSHHRSPFSGLCIRSKAKRCPSGATSIGEEFFT